MRFEDRHAQHNVTGYTLTNEEPYLHRKLIRGLKFKKIAGIASGGEIPLTVLLPKATDGVIAIDHGYNALATTYMKALLIKELGPAVFSKHLEEANYDELVAMARKLRDQLPDRLKVYCSSFDRNYISSIRREWHGTSSSTLEATHRKLEKLTLLHGDLTDLREYGPFDLLYTSNATEHSNRDKKYLKGTDLLPLLKPNGYILTTAPIVHPELKTIKTIVGIRTQWPHTLIKRVKPTSVPSATNTAPATTA
jgi:hypothetical protein